jgi:hypothetical protein
VNYDLRAKFLRQKFLPSLVEGSRAAWCGGASGDEEGTTPGARAQSAIQRAAVLYKPRLATFNFNFNFNQTIPMNTVLLDEPRSP